MRIWSFRRVALGICAAAMSAGCGGSRPLINAPGAMPQNRAIALRPKGTNYKVLYSFGAPPDGSYPVASLIDVGGTLYGTTEHGGSHRCGYSSTGYFSCGAVFSITTSGTEKVLYSFHALPDGDRPVAGLLDVGGTLYGTTYYGGSGLCGYPYGVSGCGTVFTITTGGTEKVLHSFGGSDGTDGVGPEASLIEVKGVLYSTTSGGGIHSCGLYTGNCGTVFSITPGGTEKVLHSFRSGRRHARFPLGSLADAGGTLYGTTYEGGPYSCREVDGCGTIFSITLGGKANVLHTFGNGTDGKLPSGDLIELKGTFYGTTSQGGAYGDGTVFSITPGGAEKVLHSFGRGIDGKYPVKDLIEVKGTFYGMTGGGGEHNCGGTTGCGTVFSITPGGAEKVLHSFGSSSDGTSPVEGLIDVKGTLYGTTYGGGTYGYGTVFALSP